MGLGRNETFVQEEELTLGGLPELDKMTIDPSLVSYCVPDTHLLLHMLKTAISRENYEQLCSQLMII